MCNIAHISFSYAKLLTSKVVPVFS